MHFNVLTQVCAFKVRSFSLLKTYVYVRFSKKIVKKFKIEFFLADFETVTQLASKLWNWLGNIL